MERLLLLLLLAVGTHSLGGVFELRLKSYQNPTHRDSDGLCCINNLNNLKSECGGVCQVKFRICVKNYQVSIDHFGSCYFGEKETDVGFANKVLHFPFQFRWPGTFSLIIDALHQEQNGTRLLSRMAIQQYLDMGEEWKDREWRGQNEVNLKYDYRVRCLPDYYGEACDKTCRPRDDKFGHYTCSEFGDIVCLEGWSGEYCERALCSPSCHHQHGHCTTPNTCLCHSGWTGPHCTLCLRYPGCKHGTCSKPFECECDEGWGGLFCNQDLNYCTNHKPCLNGGTCFNTGQGHYTCECVDGWGGVDCGIRVDDQCGCGNGGTCRENGTTSFCLCPEPFTGPKCTQLSTTCENTPCLNGATCIDINSQISCICPQEYSGPLCAQPVSLCPHHCLNNGSCVNNICHCSLGYTGPDCSQKINICATLPCANGGTCEVLQNNQFKCLCKNGFTSQDCSEKCHCLFGQCVNNSCVCDSGYYGELCELAAAKLTDVDTTNIIFIIIVSVSVPLLLIISVGVVTYLRRKSKREQRLNDEIARMQNEQNTVQCLSKSYDNNIVNVLDNRKVSNLDLSKDNGGMKGGGEYFSGGGNRLHQCDKMGYPHLYQNNLQISPPLPPQLSPHPPTNVLKNNLATEV